MLYRSIHQESWEAKAVFDVALGIMLLLITLVAKGVGGFFFSPEIVALAYWGARFPRPYLCVYVLAFLVLADSLYAWLWGSPVFGAWTYFSDTGLLVIAALAALFCHKATGFFYYLMSSVVLYWLWTNFGVWCVSGMYSLNAFGLLRCYVMALPFLAYSAMATLCWGVIVMTCSVTTAKALA
jgi:hypothetical protein